eukprot:COSAG02_NODE_34613_length_481_cov_0.895288_1_plen_58_part_10
MQPAGRTAVRILLTADQNWIAAYRWCIAPPGGGAFIFKQKKAYEIRIRDWSSDVCSSD